jgi:hypothetical protein
LPRALAASVEEFDQIYGIVLLVPLHPLAQFLGRLALVRPEFRQECHQAGINMVGLLLAVCALELPTQQSASATGDACHVFPPLA